MCLGAMGVISRQMEQFHYDERRRRIDSKIEEVKALCGSTINATQIGMVADLVDKEMTHESLRNLSIAWGIAALPFAIPVAGPLMGTLVASKVGLGTYNIGKAAIDGDSKAALKAIAYTALGAVELDHGTKG